jgi:hypothetical protein
MAPHHVLCVAHQETLADKLADAVTGVPEVLVVGICGPEEAATMRRVTAATLVVAWDGTPIPERDALGAPVLFVAPDARPADVVRAFLAARTVPESPPDAVPATVQRLLPASRRMQIRIGWYGTRGGAGTTTAAVTAALLLAARGQRVALYDAPQRGDPYLLLGLTPSEQPAAAGTITVYPSLALDDARVDHDAIVIDGGRRRQLFPARWIAVDKPLAEAEVAHLLGLVPGSEPEGC